jgi:iron complex transport system substrate-binding protein
MGADDEALEQLAGTLESSPAWRGLSAVKAGRSVVLPKDLFHLKPNARWAESYAILADILYGAQ